MKLLLILLTWTPLVYLLPVEPYFAHSHKVEWDQLICDFGNIPFGKPVSGTFEVTNIGSETLVIKKVQGSCGCTATDYTKEPILPGEKGSILATYNAKTMGSFNKTISVYTNAQEDPFILTVKGNVNSESN